LLILNQCLLRHSRCYQASSILTSTLLTSNRLLVRKHRVSKPALLLRVSFAGQQRFLCTFPSVMQSLLTLANNKRALPRSARSLTVFQHLGVPSASKYVVST